MKATIDAAAAGTRCDALVARFGRVSRQVARRLVESGAVSCDGELVTSPRRPIAAGAVLEFEVPAPPPDLEGREVAFTVRYEDAHLAVVDKPPGVVTHPGAGDAGPTLAEGILHRWPAVRGVGAVGRWGIVHRLDKDTSGLLVVALTAEAERGLRRAMAARRVRREYLVLVAGGPTTPTGTIDAPLGRDPARPTRMRVDPDGRPAVTHYRVEEGLSGFTLLRVNLETGRTHQIRVHLAAIGLPVAGDRSYGVAAGSPRVFLHAARLAFDHPVTGEPIEVASPLPADLDAALRAAR